MPLQLIVAEDVENFCKDLCKLFLQYKKYPEDAWFAVADDLDLNIFVSDEDDGEYLVGVLYYVNNLGQTITDVEHEKVIYREKM